MGLTFADIAGSCWYSLAAVLPNAFASVAMSQLH